MNSPFVIHDPVTPPIFAGREKEIKLLETAILGSGESVALFGNDAIGKSSIIKSFCQMVEPKDRKILMINLNVFDFKTAIETDTFLSYVTHQICTAIWMELMGKTFSNLLEDAVLQDKGSLTDTEFERAVKRIYRIVTSVKISGVGKATNEIGAEFFIKGKTVSEYQYTSERKPLATFEFLNLLDELISIIKEYGYHSILLVSDQINHLPGMVNVEFLRTYLEMFASRSIRFLITVVNPDRGRQEIAKLLLESVNHVLEVKTFENSDQVKQLILNVINKQSTILNMEEGFCESLLHFTDGHPWWIQKIGDAAFLNCVKSQKSTLTTNMVEQGFNLFAKEIEIYRDQMSKGEHFMRYHLNPLNRY